MSSSSSYHITEPHPSVPISQYLYSGRGGAGNIAHVDPKSLTKGTSASGPASRTSLPPSRSYTSGRGGAGNLHAHASERPIFSFDEELERQRRMMEHLAPVYHIGRGGAGNFGTESTIGRRSSAVSQASSASSTGQTIDAGMRTSLEGTWNRIRGSFSK